MKRIWCLLCLLCLILCGCGERGTPSSDGPSNAPLSALEGDEKLLNFEDRTPAGMYEATGMYLGICTVRAENDLLGLIAPASAEAGPLEAAENCFVGPAGYTPMGTCMLSEEHDLFWTDLDGDGVQEVLYWTYGPTSGLFTVALWAYGLEQGVPVCKAQTIYNLRFGAVRLTLDAGTVTLCLTPNVFDAETREDRPGEELRVPLRIEAGGFVPVSGELPEEIQGWGSDFYFLPGVSFFVLEEAWAETLVYRSRHCLISRTNASDGKPEVRAAVSSDGIRVTGWQKVRQGEELNYAGGLTPIPVPEDLSALAGLTLEELTERLGPPHFDDGSGLYLLYANAASALILRFDGERFYLNDGGRETSYGYLIGCDEDDPPAQAGYERSASFLLSDDPEMTWDRYMTHMLSSAWDPDFSPTRSLFTLYC